MKPLVFLFELDQSDRKLLDELAAAAKLSRAQTLRLLIRYYGDRLKAKSVESGRPPKAIVARDMLDTLVPGS
jgi:hypothetical protein